MAGKVVFVEEKKEKWRNAIFLLRLAGLEVAPFAGAEEAANWIFACRGNGIEHDLLIVTGRSLFCEALAELPLSLPVLCVTEEGCERPNAFCRICRREDLVARVKEILRPEE